ncbi:MAG: small basic family protein [Clostridia bacterium]
MVGIIILLVFIILGFITGINFIVPYAYSKYIAVAILACLDSVFGAFTANIEKNFRINVFISGFFGNALIAILLVFIGEKLNVDIYLAAVIVFSGRLLNNFSTIRRQYIQKLDEKVANIKLKNEKIKEKL